MKCPRCGHIFNSKWPSECLEERCSYYTHYLRHGPPDLGHAAFHTAERMCQYAQEQAEVWQKLHAEGELPRDLEARCIWLEREVRA